MTRTAPNSVAMLCNRVCGLNQQSSFSIATLHIYQNISFLAEMRWKNIVRNKDVSSFSQKAYFLTVFDDNLPRKFLR